MGRGCRGVLGVMLLDKLGGGGGAIFVKMTLLKSQYFLFCGPYEEEWDLLNWYNVANILS